MISPFFSIIIPAFNRETLIEGAIRSVLNQHFKDFEIIVIDDGSVDGTAEVVKRIEDERVRYFYQQNLGVTQARNNAAAKASGRYFIFLDSDDELTSGFLEQLHDRFTNGNFLIGFGFAKFIDQHGKQIRYVVPERKGPHNYYPPFSGAFAIDRKLFFDFGGYDPKLSFSENSDFFLRLQLEKRLPDEAVCLIPTEGVIVNFRDSDGRFEAYSFRRFESTGHYLEKHKAYFAKSPQEFVNYKTIFAVAAYQNGHVRQANQAIKEVIRRKPLKIKPYFQLILFNFPLLANLYWKKSKARSLFLKYDSWRRRKTFSK